MTSQIIQRTIKFPNAAPEELALVRILVEQQRSPEVIKAGYYDIVVATDTTIQIHLETTLLKRGNPPSSEYADSVPTRYIGVNYGDDPLGSGSAGIVYKTQGTLFLHSDGRTTLGAAKSGLRSAVNPETGQMDWEVHGRDMVVKVPYRGSVLTLDVTAEAGQFRDFGDFAEVAGSARGLDATGSAVGGVLLEKAGDVDLEKYLTSPDYDITPQVRLELAKQLLAVTAELRAQGIVHRDLKPQNIMVDLSDPQHPQLTIIDKGDALKITRDPVSGSVISVKKSSGSPLMLGTRCYIAPEVAGDFWSWDYKGHSLPMERMDEYATLHERADEFAVSGMLAQIFGATDFSNLRVRIVRDDDGTEREQFHLDQPHDYRGLFSADTSAAMLPQQKKVMEDIIRGLGEVDPKKRWTSEQANKLFDLIVKYPKLLGIKDVERASKFWNKGISGQEAIDRLRLCYFKGTHNAELIKAILGKRKWWQRKFKFTDEQKRELQELAGRDKRIGDAISSNPQLAGILQQSFVAQEEIVDESHLARQARVEAESLDSDDDLMLGVIRDRSAASTGEFSVPHAIDDGLFATEVDDDLLTSESDAIQSLGGLDEMGFDVASDDEVLSLGERRVAAQVREIRQEGAQNYDLEKFGRDYHNLLGQSQQRELTQDEKLRLSLLRGTFDGMKPHIATLRNPTASAGQKSEASRRIAASLTAVRRQIEQDDQRRRAKEADVAIADVRRQAEERRAEVRARQRGEARPSPASDRQRRSPDMRAGG